LRQTPVAALPPYNFSDFLLKNIQQFRNAGRIWDKAATEGGHFQEMPNLF
jgi:hypothetical protein